jgi:hypothetical protein
MLLAGGRAALRRFPLVILSGVVAAVAAILAIDSDEGRTFARWFVTASLGLPLFFALALFGERRFGGGSRVAWLRLGGFVLLAAFFFGWPRWSDPVAITRYFQLSVGLHLLAAVLPYAGVDEPNGFWQYNRALFLRFLTAGIYSAVLFVGLALALAALDNLLGVSVPDESYFRLLVAIAFVFNTWFFAAGVPADLPALEGYTDYPKGLRVFAQFILVPLVIVYLLIVTAYLGRVIVTRVWPSGWTGYLVSALATVGILAILLVHPERERKDQPWIEIYARWFYVGLFPSIIMLLMAIWQRIGQYGITERRYLLSVLALWLLGIAIYYALTRSRNIKWIPTTLAMVAFFTFLGPWSVYDVSRASQRGRLQGLLETHGLLVDGVASAATAAVPATDREQITAVFRYLIENHGTASIDSWFEGRLAEIDTIGGVGPSGRGEARERTALIMRQLALETVGPGGAVIGEYVTYQARPSEDVRLVRGFDYVLPDANLQEDRFVTAGDTISLDIEESRNLLHIFRNGVELIEVPLEPLLEQAEAGRIGAYPRDPAVTAEAMRLEVESGDVGVRLYVSSMTLRVREGGAQIQTAAGDVHLRLESRDPPPP